MRKALKEVNEAGVNALVVYLGNFGPETSETLLAKYFEPQIIPPEKTGKLVRDRRFAGIETALGQVNFGALQPIGYNLGGYNCEDNTIF